MRSSSFIVALIIVVLLSAVFIFSNKTEQVNNSPQINFDLPITDKDAPEIAVVHEGSEIDERY